jgi:DNA-binding NarL/FixJ family response regulator
MEPTRLRIAVVGQHELEQAALAALVASLPGLEVVARDADPPPHVVICDGAQPPAAVRPRPPGSVLWLTTDAAGLPVERGVAGLFSKDEGPAGLALAIRQVARGEQYVSPALVPALLDRLAHEWAPASADLSALSERERDVLALLGRGLSNKAIAARLYLSVRTVEGHLAKLYAQLDVHSRTEAALIAVQSGLTARDR